MSEVNKENEKLKEDDLDKHLEEPEQGLLDVTEKMILEHPTYKELAAKLLQEEQKSGEYKNNWLSSQAALENLKRRTQKDIANAHKYALEKFAHEVVVTVDNLERSLQVKSTDNETGKDFYVGIELTLKSLLEVLAKFGITSVNPLGGEFDPEKHTAMSTKEGSDAKPNMVLEVVQKGYLLNDRLLRPALVVVAK